MSRISIQDEVTGYHIHEKYVIAYCKNPDFTNKKYITTKNMHASGTMEMISLLEAAKTKDQVFSCFKYNKNDVYVYIPVIVTDWEN